MKVLIVSNAFADKEQPVGIFELDQAVSLKNNGVEVSIIAFDIRTVFHSKHLKSFSKLVNGVQALIIPLDIRFLPKKIKYQVARFFFKVRFYKKVKKENYDVIHAHWGNNAYIVSSVCKKLGIPLVITEHSSSVNFEKPSSLYFEVAKKAYREASTLICVGNTLRKNLKESTGLDFEFIPNVLDPTVFRKFDKKKSSASEAIKLISVGHLIPIKNYELLIRCIKELNNPNIKLSIFGEGYLKEELNELIVSLGLEDSIKLEGNVCRNVLMKSYQECDGFVLLSKSETFGVAFIEAMACGLPVFSSPNGGTFDIIKNDFLGIICDSFEICKICQKLKLFIDKIYDYDSNYIMEYCFDNFDQNKIANDLLNVYRKTLNGGK